MKRIRSYIGTTAMYIFLSVIVLISIGPLIWIFVSSFKTNSEILNGALTIPQSFSFKSYEAVFRIQPLFVRFYLNSVIVALFGTLANVFLISMASYVLARFDFRFKNLIFVTLSLSLLIPMVALMHPIFLTIKTLGLYDTMPGLILVYVSLGLPVTLFLMRSYFLTISKEIEDSASIDGAGFFRVYMQIITPMAIPAYATAAILQFLLCWNEYLFALLLTTATSNRTLPLALSFFKSQFQVNYPSMFAAMIMTILPGIIIFILLQEKIVEGLTSGSLKA